MPGNQIVRIRSPRTARSADGGPDRFGVIALFVEVARIIGDACAG
jgi:hypothetical protein